MCTRGICMYTGQRHRSVLINSAMYISDIRRATLVFSRASHDAKVVYYFFVFAFWTARLWLGVNHFQVVAAYNERFFRHILLYFPLYTRRSCLRANFGSSFIIVIRLQNDCKCCTVFVKPVWNTWCFNVTCNNACKYISVIVCLHSLQIVHCEVPAR